MALIFGDPSLRPTLSGEQEGGDQVLPEDFIPPGANIDNQNNTLVGDVEEITEEAEGGNDTVTGGNNSGSGTIFNSLSGDAFNMSGEAEGGDDTLMGGSIKSGASGTVLNFFRGEVADKMTDWTEGGDDTLMGGNIESGASGRVENFFRGEARDMSGEAEGGDDELTGGDNTGDGIVENFLFGDAGRAEKTNGDPMLTGDMSGDAEGGDDTLMGGSNYGGGFVENFLYGDALSMFGEAEGGDDRLISGENSMDEMWGDAASMSVTATGGSDTFVFADAFGSDSVFDFDQAEDDLIEFQVAGIDSFDDIESRIVFDGVDTVITTSAFDTVTLVNYDNDANMLTADDFIFV